MEKITLLGITQTATDQRVIFQIGRQGFALVLFLFSLVRLCGGFGREQELRAYFNMWQWLSPQIYQSTDDESPLVLFYQQSYFEFQRFITLLAIMFGSSAIMRDGNKYGCLLCFISMTYFAIVNANPFLISHTATESEVSHILTWQLLAKMLPVVSGLLLVLSKGDPESHHAALKLKTH